MDYMWCTTSRDEQSGVGWWALLLWLQGTVLQFVLFDDSMMDLRITCLMHVE
jgi:hypothetical protein